MTITPLGRLDVRLRHNALAVKVADLVAVFINHRPGQAAACSACGHRYTITAPLCPSLVLTRTLLKARWHENRSAIAPIAKEFHRRDDRVLPNPGPNPDPPEEPTAELFAITPTWIATRR